MKHKSILNTALFITGLLFFAACNNESSKEEKSETTSSTPESSTNQPEVHGTEVKPGDVTLETPLNQQWVTAGKATYELKCQSCHKLTDERLVGPGWAGVTKRREPHWIMNMITNVDMMLETDAEAQKLLEQCLVRMPNQNISKEESRQIIEFMRSNDGEK
jgi:mono/diheme cytochrome c family protein